ncbi:MAG: hypothetical protein D5S00_05650 [Tindallia sp. MSAO_Bac2]|nr:MAG: hypothetical protein D5S00_05650 [Tindallia sp. MSAO_Bac2]
MTLAALPPFGGTVNVDAKGWYPPGAEVTVEATPAEGFVFDGWTAPAGEFVDANDATTTFTMPAQDVTVEALFNLFEFSCPFVYSYDGSKYHFEHEAIPFSVFRALENTSYGNLRMLNAVDGKYHISIREELDEISFVNGFMVSAVDYPENTSVKEVMVDIYGNPHTIKERITPDKFNDSKGNSKLEEVTQKGVLVSSNLSLMDGEYVEAYEATFNIPEYAGEDAKLMISAQKTEIVNQVATQLIEKIDGKNNLWWVERVLDTPTYKNITTDFVSIFKMWVEIWDGKEWVKQGEIEAGMHLLEEFLVPLNLNIIEDKTNNIKVRLRSGAGFYELDQVSIDFYKNVNMDKQELVPQEAVFNDEDDVKSVIGDFDNDKRIRMYQGDKIDLVYEKPLLGEGYQRGVNAKIKCTKNAKVKCATKKSQY